MYDLSYIPIKLEMAKINTSPTQTMAINQFLAKISNIDKEVSHSHTLKKEINMQ